MMPQLVHTSITGRPAASRDSVRTQSPRLSKVCTSMATPSPLGFLTPRASMYSTMESLPLKSSVIITSEP